MIEQDVLWIIYRDNLPRPAMERVVQFACDCITAYKSRTGVSPTLLGVSSTFPELAELQIASMGLKVVRNLPAWAHEEVWVGGPDGAGKVAR
jgi:hypothetical protein